jgi:hypothetical protein
MVVSQKVAENLHRASAAPNARSPVEMPARPHGGFEEVIAALPNNRPRLMEPGGYRRL